MFFIQAVSAALTVAPSCLADPGRRCRLLSNAGPRSPWPRARNTPGRLDRGCFVFSMESCYGDVPLEAGIRSRHIDGVNGLSMHVLEAGGPDRPLVVLLH